MTAFGIDLGTVNSCIAHVDASGRPVVLRNAIGRETTPSVVYFEGPGRVVVGEEARSYALIAPERVARLFKRQMGTEGPGRPYHGKRHTPEEISAYVLRDLAESARKELGEPVKDVVITVPAYFGVAEQAATRRAGEIAGLNVLAVLTEPVAAAMSHQQRHPVTGTRYLLVYDLGGGTFDTSVIRVTDGTVDVVCTNGALDLGGADWDARVVAHLRKEFLRHHPKIDPTADPESAQELLDQAEELKHHLSRTLSRQRVLRFSGETLRLDLTREKLEELTADLLERTFQITRKTLDDAARRGVPEVDEVILVGGMTRMPAVEEGLRSRFGLPVRRHEPDLAVARGAALFAVTRQGGSAEDLADAIGVTTAQAKVMKERTVSTVVSRGLGIKVTDERDPLLHTDPARARQYIAHLLPAGTSLPGDTGPVMTATVLDNQPMIEIEVWESRPGTESEELADNNRIGSGRLRLPPRTPARTMIHVTFLLSETGSLTVSAVDPRNGNELRYELQIGGMDQERLEQARAEVMRAEVSS